MRPRGANASPTDAKGTPSKTKGAPNGPNGMPNGPKGPPNGAKGAKWSQGTPNGGYGEAQQRPREANRGPGEARDQKLSRMVWAKRNKTMHHKPPA